MAPAPDTAVLGEHLRALREASGASLGDMAVSTRISERYLAALEEGATDDLPAPVFVKGFIRSYCAFIGAPADESLAMYDRARGVSPVAPTPSVPLPRRGGWIGHPIVLSSVLLLIFGGGLLALRLGQPLATKRTIEPAIATRAPEPPPPAAPLPAPVAAPTEPSPIAASAPVPMPSAPTSTAAAPTTNESQRLLIRAVEPTWIRVQTDDGRVVEVLLPAGAQREWTSDKHFVLTIGNAGGIEIVFNGRTLPSLGARGAVIRRLSLPEASGSGS
jgi:cytoskeleton protein RodZ